MYDVMQDGEMQLFADVARLFEGAFIWLMTAGTSVATIILLYVLSCDGLNSLTFGQVHRKFSLLLQYGQKGWNLGFP